MSDAAGRKNHLPVGNAIIAIIVVRTRDIAMICMIQVHVSYVCVVKREPGCGLTYAVGENKIFMLLNNRRLCSRRREGCAAKPGGTCRFILAELPSLSLVSFPTSFFITIIAKRPGTIKRYSQEYSRSSRHDARLRQAIGGDSGADQRTPRGWFRSNHHPPQAQGGQEQHLSHEEMSSTAWNELHASGDEQEEWKT